MAIQTDDFAPAPRVVSAAPVSPKEEAIERALRPKLLDEYVGQHKVRDAARAELAALIAADAQSPDANLYRALVASMDFEDGETAKAITEMEAILDTYKAALGL